MSYSTAQAGCVPYNPSILTGLFSVLSSTYTLFFPPRNICGSPVSLGVIKDGIHNNAQFAH